VQKLKGKGARPDAIRPITPEFLRSQAYQDLMNKHVPWHGDPGLHEAQTWTKSFQERHFTSFDELQTFRWRGFQHHLELLLEHLLGREVVDLGGAAGPVGLGSVVVDQLDTDVFGRPIPYKSLSALPGPVDTVISSHTFEHIPDLVGVLGEVRKALRPGGTLIAHVPAFSCERWRVGIHRKPEFGDHVWTFGLSGTTTLPSGLRNYAEVDKMIAEQFDVQMAEYVGDDSILVVAAAGR
jgi:hypothetical protein